MANIFYSKNVCSLSIRRAMGTGMKLKQAMFLMILLSAGGDFWIELASGSELDELVETIESFQELQDKGPSAGATCDLTVLDSLSQDVKKLSSLEDVNSLADVKVKYGEIKDVIENVKSYKTKAGEICRTRDNIVCDEDSTNDKPEGGKVAGTCKSCEDSSLTDKGKTSCSLVADIKTFDTERASPLLEKLRKFDALVDKGEDALKTGKETLNTAKQTGKDALNKVNVFGGSPEGNNPIVSVGKAVVLFLAGAAAGFLMNGFYFNTFISEGF